MMIVATAGHIDHGKTALVRALSGVDTDRLPEEKARGISIDLGFAYWTTDEAETVGFVDVPGHERFVRNMLAGVCAIDFVLFVVAADDGVMPQTREHLQIVNLLGVSHGVAVITKTDRVAESRVDEVRASVAALLAPTALAGVDIVAVSAVTGAGIAALRRLVAAAALRRREARSSDQGLRYAIDRAFAVAGSGTVVTGTVFAGAVAPGDRVLLSPSGLPVRVRGVQVHGQAVLRAGSGERCALNLVGVELAQVSRGDWVIDPELHAPTRQIDVRLTFLAGEARALRHWTPVHVHLGTGAVLGRVAIARDGSLEPGASALVGLVLENAIVAAHGDRFIVRDQSATRTIGGGVVVDPHPPRRRRNSPLRQAQLLALDRGEGADALAGLQTCSPAGLDVAAFRRSFNLSATAMELLLEAGRWLTIGREQALPGDIAEAMAQRIDDAVTRFYAGAPQAIGIEMAALRDACAPGLPAPNFAAFLRRIAPDRQLEVRGSLVCSLRLVARESAADLSLWQKARTALEEAGFAGLDVAALAATIRAKEAVLRDVLHRKARGPELFLVAPDVFFARRTLAEFAVRTQLVAARQAEGRFTAAAVRDEVAVSRARTVQLLECLDRLGITLRNGNVRIVRRSGDSVLGDGRPVATTP